MIVSMWMTRELVTIGPNAPIAEAAGLMAENRIRRLPVVERLHGNDHLVGIVSATDIFHAYPPRINPFAVLLHQTPEDRKAVHEIMTSHPVTVSPDSPIELAASLMRDRKFGALPVVHEGKLDGLITESDVFRAFANIFSAAEAGVRISFALGKREDAFHLISGFAARHAVHVLNFFTAIERDTPVCVVQLAGQGIDEMLDEIWKSEHRVLSVVHLESTASSESGGHLAFP